MSGLDLYQTQRALALLFVYAAAAGFGLGCVYDLLRILRVFCGDTSARGEKGRRPPLLAILLFTEDLLFSILTAVTLILLCYYANDGQLRAPAVLGMAGGFFVYMQMVGRLTVKAAEPLSKLVKRLVRFVFLLLLRPIFWVGAFLHRLFCLLWRGTVGKALQKRREKQTERRVEALKASAKRGFDLMEDANATAHTAKKSDRPRIKPR